MVIAIRVFAFLTLILFAVASSAETRSLFLRPNSGYQGQYGTTEQFEVDCTFVVGNKVYQNGPCRIAFPLKRVEQPDDCVSLFADKDWVQICRSAEGYDVSWTGGEEGDGQHADFALGRHSEELSKLSVCFNGQRSQFCYNMQ